MTPFITPIMGISSPCIFGKESFDMLKSIGFGDLVRLLLSSRKLIGSSLIDLCEIWLGGSLECNLRGNQ